MIGLRAQNINLGMVQDAMNDDIIKSIHKLFPVAVMQMRNHAEAFRGDSRLQTAKNVWDYEKQRISYKRDPNQKQKIRLPSRFVNDRDGDCKSYALFAAATLANLGMPVKFRYASYKPDNSTPSHVYMVTEDENGNEIIVDGVYNKFNAEKKPTFKKDYPMEVLALAGINEGVGKLNFKKFAKESFMPGGLGLKLLLKRIKHMKPKQRERLAKKLKMLGKLTPGLEKKLLGHLLSKGGKPLMKGAGVFDNDPGYGVDGINGKRKKGKFFKKLGKLAKGSLAFHKKLALVLPRKMFMFLVRLNFRGIAKKLLLSYTQLPGKTDKLWKSLGGNPNVLKRAVTKGAKKKAFFGAKKSLRGINGGIGEAISIGAAVAAAVAILGAFAGILKAVKGKGGDATLEDGSGSTSQLDSMVDSAKQSSAFSDLQNNNFGGGGGGGSSSGEGSDDGANMADDKKAADGEDKDDEGGSGIPGWMIAAGLGGAFFLLNK